MGCIGLITKMESGRGIKRLAYRGHSMIPTDVVNINE